MLTFHRVAAMSAEALALPVSSARRDAVKQPERSARRTTTSGTSRSPSSLLAGSDRHVKQDLDLLCAMQRLEAALDDPRERDRLSPPFVGIAAGDHQLHYPAE